MVRPVDPAFDDDYAKADFKARPFRYMLHGDRDKLPWLRNEAFVIRLNKTELVQLALEAGTLSSEKEAADLELLTQAAIKAVDDGDAHLRKGTLAIMAANPEFRRLVVAKAKRIYDEDYLLKSKAEILAQDLYNSRLEDLNPREKLKVYRQARDDLGLVDQDGRLAPNNEEVAEGNKSRNSSLTPDQQLNIRSRNVQELLMENLDRAVLAHSIVIGHSTSKDSPKMIATPGGSTHARHTETLNQFGQHSYKDWHQHIVPYHGDPNTLVDKFTNPPAARYFTNATPAQLSMLQPLLRFFIQDNRGNSQEIYFPDYTDANNLSNLATMRASSTDDLLKSRKKRGTDVGIKSFEWNYQNIHEGDRVIEASLQLHFGSLMELVNEDYLQFLFLNGDPNAFARPLAEREADETPHERLIRLEERLAEIEAAAKRVPNPRKYKDPEGNEHIISDGQSRDTASVLQEPANAPKKDFRQLKVICGWSVPKGSQDQLYTLFEGGSTNSRRKKLEQFLEGVRATQQAIVLNLTDYDVSFEQDGRTTLTISFVGSADSYFASNESCVLGSANADQREQLNKKDITLGTEQIDEIPAKLYGGPGGGFIASRILMGSGSDRFMKINLNDIRAEFALLKTKSEILKLRAALPGYDKGSEAESKALDERLKGTFYLDSLVKKRLAAERYSQFLNRLTHNDLSSNFAGYNIALLCAQVVTRIKRQDPQTGLGDVSSEVVFLPYGSENSHVSAAGGKGTHGPTGFLDVALEQQRKRLQLFAAMYEAIKKDDKTQYKLNRDKLRKEIRNTFDRERSSYHGTAGVTGDLWVYNVFYIRLGDLLVLAAENADMRQDIQMIIGTLDRLSAGGDSDLDMYNSRFISIYDIPIALDYFNQWMLDKVIYPGRQQWPWRNFLDDIITLATTLLNFNTTRNARLNLGYTLYTSSRSLPGHFPDLFKWGQAGVHHADGSQNYVGDTAILTESHLDRFPFDNELARALRSRNIASNAVLSAGAERYLHVRRPISYYILFSRDTSLRGRRGIREEDERDGIYHYTLGAERGLAKSFNFKKQEQPFYREMKISELNVRGFSQALIIPQNLQLELVGNNLHKNGDIIYVDSRALLGQYANHVLALGGYYGVYRSDHEITPQGFVTTLYCIFMRHTLPNEPQTGS
ncbi:MAG TPA: hypothetical protein DEQ32_05595 [Gammaproteobacteria bacterium]|nr:hypothetical protein [Gammaproteobacteria bacterium]